MERNIDNLLPILAVERDCILNKKGDVTVAFRVELPEIFTLSADEYELLHYAWVKAVKVLPKHSILHKQDWFVTEKFQPSFESENFLDRASDRYFNERPHLRHECYLFITRVPSNRKYSTSLFSSLLRPSIVPEDLLDPRFVHDLTDAAGQLKSILESTGLLQLTRLSTAEILSSRRHKGILEQYCSLNGGAERPRLGDLSFDGGLTVGDNHCQLYTLADAEDLPATCGSRINFDKYSTDKTKFSIGFASTLGQLLPCNHLYNQYLFVQDAQLTLKQLETKRLRLQSLSAYSRENAIARDGVNDFLNEAIAYGRLPVKAHFNVLVWTDEKDELKEIKNLVSSGMAQIDAVAKLETVGAPQIFWAGIPGNAADFPMNDTFDTFAEQAACFLNMETSYRSSLSPFGIRLGDRLSGLPLHVDISDEPMVKGICTNRNKFILGPSGSGKSFFTNHMVRSYYEQGTHVVLVDVGHSYKGLSDLLGGYYFTYSEENPIQFNPFFVGEGDFLDTEKKESIKTLLLALWKKVDELYRRSEYVALSNAIQLYYDKLERDSSIFPSFDTFYEFLKSDFVEVLDKDGVKEKDFDVSNFLYVLRPYYKGGEFDYLLNARKNLDLLNERLVIFEIDAIKDHPILFPTCTIIIMQVFINKMRKLKGQRKMILIEEAWKALMKEGFAEYIKYLFKTVRKFFGEAVVVTQDIEDIISSPIVKQAIINNSDCKILLDQSKYQNKFDAIQELLGLTDKEKSQVLSLNKANEPGARYKEVFISLGGVQSKVFRTEVSPEEYFAYTTEQKEKVKVYEYAARYGGDLRKGIAAMVKETKS